MFVIKRVTTYQVFLFMKEKEKIVKAVFEAVEKVAEPKENWKTANDEESVICRTIVINVLYHIGWTRSRIIETTGWKKSCVVNHINSFEIRKKCSRILIVWHTQIIRELNDNPLFSGLL